MSEHGIFINHRHDHRQLAGRIYDFFRTKGLKPFLDVYSLRQGLYTSAIEEQVKATPYFLCVLTEGALDKLEKDDVYYKELEAAFRYEKKILLIISEGFTFPKTLPEKIKDLPNHQYYTILNDMSNFFYEMERLYETDIDWDKLEGIISWRERAKIAGNTLLLSRDAMEADIASVSNRFGKEFVQCVKENKAFTGEQRVKYIHMSCYAASIIFASDKNLVDERAYDRGLISRIFQYLLQDEEFSFELITSAPDSLGAQDAVVNKKLGNSSLEEYPEAIFLASYANIKKLLKENEIYKKASEERRFRFMVSECVMPYSIFQIVYKKKWEEYNHVKIELYSEGIVSNMERRSIIIFEKDDKENYDFFVNRYNYLRNLKKSKELIKTNHEKWIKDWNDLRSM